MIYAAYYDTPIGPLSIHADEGALKALRFHARPLPGAQSSPLIEEAHRQLCAYFDGALRTFDLPLAPEGTAFFKRVWEELGRIPYGQTTTYGELAKRVERPGAARAVGNANNKNPLPIFIPCHRVLGADGRLVGFGGGLDVKAYLLRLEDAPFK